MMLTMIVDIRDKFKDYMREYSPKSRQFYGYLTSVVVRRNGPHLRLLLLSDTLTGY